MREGNGWIELSLTEIPQYEEAERLEVIRQLEEAEKQAEEITPT